MDHFRRSMTSYLSLIGGACLVCSIFINPAAMIFIWAFTAVGLQLLGKSLRDRSGM